MECCGSISILGLATTAIVASIVWLFIIPLAHWRFKGIPYVSGVPFLGSLKDSFLQRITLAEEYQRIYLLNEGQRYVGFHKFIKPSILVRDPEIVKDVMIRDFSSFHDNDFDVTTDMEPIMGRNLFFLHGDLWKSLRSSLTPAFSPGKIKTVTPLIMNVVQDLKNYLQEYDGDEVELKDLLASYTINVVGSCAFGIKLDALRQPDEEFRVMGRKMLEPTPARGFGQLIVMNWPTLARILKVPFIPKVCEDFFRRMIRDVVLMRQRSGESRKDFLNMMLELKSAGKLGVRPNEGTPEADGDEKSKSTNFDKVINDPESLDDVTAQAVGFFLDGYETSSTLISFTLFELAHNPDVQEKLRREVEEIKLAHGGTVTYEALQEMLYLDKVIKESLRKHPPVPFSARRCTKRYHFPAPDENTPKGRDGFWVEEGTPIVIPIYALHHDNNYFPDPEAFDPERFSKDVNRDGSGLHYLPFGEGPRICIGNRFGLLQSKAVIAEVVANFALMPCLERTPVPIELDPKSLLLLSKNKLWVKFRKL